MVPSGLKMSSIDSMPNEYIGIAMEVEDVSLERYGKKLSEPTHYGEQNEWDWTNHGETVLEGVVERKNGSKIVPYSPFVQSSH